MLHVGVFEMSKIVVLRSCSPSPTQLLWAVAMMQVGSSMMLAPGLRKDIKWLSVGGQEYQRMGITAEGPWRVSTWPLSAISHAHARA